jgi:hypothetical protein
MSIPNELHPGAFCEVTLIDGTLVQGQLTMRDDQMLGLSETLIVKPSGTAAEEPQCFIPLGSALYIVPRRPDQQAV